MSRQQPDFDFSDAPAEEQEPRDPEPRLEQQRPEAERLAAEHRQPDPGRHGEDRSRPRSVTRMVSRVVLT